MALTSLHHSPWAKLKISFAPNATINLWSGKKTWPDDIVKDASEDFFYAERFFKNFHIRALKDYVKYGLVESGNGLKLEISVKKEVAIYRKLLTKYPNSVYNVNGVIIYGARDSIHWSSDINWIKKKFAKMNIFPFPGNHFFPLENPESTANIIKRFLWNN